MKKKLLILLTVLVCLPFVSCKDEKDTPESDKQAAVVSGKQLVGFWKNTESDGGASVFNFTDEGVAYLYYYNPDADRDIDRVGVEDQYYYYNSDKKMMVRYYRSQDYLGKEWDYMVDKVVLNSNSLTITIVGEEIDNNGIEFAPQKSVLEKLIEYYSSKPAYEPVTITFFKISESEFESWWKKVNSK